MTDELVAFFKDPESKTLDLPVVISTILPDLFFSFFKSNFGYYMA